MVPKIIHNIWIEGYENLPNEIKMNYLNIKKTNPEWEFIIWDNEMITQLLKKYPSIYELYNKNIYTVYDIDSIKSHIARYIIMKEYGGLYFDIEFNCISSLDNLFLNDNKDESKNTIYIARSKINYWNYIYSLQNTKYSSSFMAMDKNHPVWEKLIENLKYATTKYQINNALDIALQKNEKDHSINSNISKSFPIVLLNKVNGDYYQCENTNTVCYMTSLQSQNFFGSTFKFITCYYKQIIIFIFAAFIIIFVEYLYMHNARAFGTINFIPGLPGPAHPSHHILQKKKKGDSKG